MRIADFERIRTSASNKLRLCWTILASLRKNLHPRFSEFQVLLAELLAHLSRVYRALGRDEEALISRKQELSTKWFARSMDRLATQKKEVLELIWIGRALGDGYAWFFYQNDQEHLQKHLEMPANPHVPGGVGGAGELSMVKDVRMYKGHLLLYHGLTSILRLGDVSLVDLKALRIVAVGEIKTVREGENELRVTMNFASRKGSASAFVGDVDAIPIAHRPSSPNHYEQRLQKQMARISKLLKPTDVLREDQRASVQASVPIAELAATIEKALRYGGASTLLKPDVVILALARKYTRRVDRLPKVVLDEFTEKAREIVLGGAALNALHVSGAMYQDNGAPIYLLGTAPFLWRGLALRACRALYLRDIEVLTAYNPAHLAMAIESTGFAVSLANRALIASKIEDGKRIELAGAAYFSRLISSLSMSHPTVVEMVQAFIERVKTQEITASTRIDLSVIWRSVEP